MRPYLCLLKQQRNTICCLWYRQSVIKEYFTLKYIYSIFRHQGRTITGRRMTTRTMVRRTGRMRRGRSRASSSPPSPSSVLTSSRSSAPLGDRCSASSTGPVPREAARCCTSCWTMIGSVVDLAWFIPDPAIRYHTVLEFRKSINFIFTKYKIITLKFC